MTSTDNLPGEPLFCTQQVRAIEARYADVDLMRRAGKATANFLLARTTRNSRVALIAGPGNNGGDTLACAAELKHAGYEPSVVLLGNPDKLPADARAAYGRAIASGVNILSSLPLKLEADWLVDGLFGIGLKRPLDGAYSDAVRAIAEARKTGAQVLALDVPSGIDADTGALVGDVVVGADHTLTFLALKPGLVTGPALDYVGTVQCARLGVDVSTAGAATATALGRDFIETTRRRPAANAHKGTHGTCIIVGGATGMLGAVLLASRAAMRSGAGKVKAGWLADPAPQVDPLMPEVMMAQASVLVTAACESMVIGCGLGTSGAAVRLLRLALKREIPLVVDADALNLVAQSAELATLMQKRKAPTIITPHPAEAARLLGCSTASVQVDRLRAARDLANGYHCIAVVKGAGTVICDGTTTSINRTGNPLLGTAGTGDVLSGMIGALLAQGYEAATAARLGVCMHGAAADALAGRGVTRAVAGNVIAELAYL